MNAEQASIVINGCLKQERQAQKLLYQYLLPILFRIGRRYLKNTEDIKDLSQEALSKVFSNLSSFKGESSIGTWASRIMINLILYKLNRVSLIRLSLEEEKDSYTYFESYEYENIIGRLIYQDLLSFIDQLPEGKKNIFNLYVIDGYSHKEIAEMLGISEGTSKAQLSRAKEILVKLHQFHNQKSDAKIY